MNDQEVLPKTILVIFGITGDLAQRYLLPSLSEIIKNTHVHDDFLILGVSRRVSEVSEVISDKLDNLRAKTQMIQLDLAQSDDYQKLKNKINALKANIGEDAQVIFYLVVPPNSALSIIEHLGSADLNDKNTKLLLEKPFGVDLASATELIEHTAKYFEESQIYRIDHYLAKEMAQNITVFLGSNAIFRNIWDGKYINKIEIDVLESIDIEGRKFYDQTGALRDIVQSHGLQLAALTLMEPCSDIFDFEEIPRRRLAALKQLTVDKSRLTLGQYKGYLKDAGVKSSNTETFARLQLSSDDPRWRNVPIIITTGKNLNQRLTEVRVFFKPVGEESPNLLRLRVQPREGIELDLWVKKPGVRALEQLPLEFAYQNHFARVPNAYEQVLTDAMTGNHSLFAGSGEILASWQILEPLLVGQPKPTLYKPGSLVSQVVDAQL